MIIGAQLYTVRNFTKNLDDFAETLKKVADIGYTTVQVSGTCPFEAEWLRDRLRENGLACVLTHTKPADITDNTEKIQHIEMLEEKQEHLRNSITDRKIRYTYHDAKTSRIEAVLARGDRRLAPALALAAEEGFAFDAWDECFDYDRWISVFERTGVDPAFYANRRFGLDEVLPWDIIDCGVSKEFMRRERDLAYGETTMPHCREKCSGCGAKKLGGERACCPSLKK